MNKTLKDCYTVRKISNQKILFKGTYDEAEDFLSDLAWETAAMDNLPIIEWDNYYELFTNDYVIEECKEENNEVLDPAS